MAELRTITKDEVVAKLKDDGDFDRLRLNIIRNLKDNEELRESLRTIVRQSTAINRPGAETMKPRQLSDAIYHEIGDKLNEKLSDGLWGIIRSSEGVKSDITETVRSVYNKMIGADVDLIEDDRANGCDRVVSKAEEPVEPPLSNQKPEIEGIDAEKKGLKEFGVDEDPDLPPGFG